MGELMVNDYARKGFVDGVALRLPTVCVRPGRPNQAASSFLSSIIREPLKGEEAVLASNLIELMQRDLKSATLAEINSAQKPPLAEFGKKIAVFDPRGVG